MKKKEVPIRNPFVVLALQRKAGSHRKSNKALRRAERSRANDEHRLLGVNLVVCYVFFLFIPRTMAYQLYLVVCLY
jgi:hypothetical protein